jgi:hypothetical protein
MLDIYGVPHGQRDALVQLARESRQKGWWNAYSDGVPPELATYLGMESAASEIRVYQVHRIPGLLQTEDYVRATLAADPFSSDANADRQVALMVERQRQAEANPPSIWAVLDEGTLRRQVGGPEVMRAQIEHLLDLRSMPNVLLQIIPFRTGAYLPMDLPFIIMCFPDQLDPDIVCMRYPTGTLWIEDTAEVERYNGIFRHLEAAALSQYDSVNLMTSVLKGF